MDEERLPGWLVERILQAQRDGITLSLRRRLPLGDPRHGEVAAIHWRPGDPNPLAQAILEDVHGQPMPLELDGHKFMITRQDWPPGWDENT